MIVSTICSYDCKDWVQQQYTNPALSLLCTTQQLNIFKIQTQTQPIFDGYGASKHKFIVGKDDKTVTSESVQENNKNPGGMR